MRQGRPPHRFRSALVLVALCTSALGAAPAYALGGTTVTPTPSATAPGAVAQLPAQVTLTGITPALLTSAGTLTVAGVITNTDAEPLEVVYARLRFVRARLTTRDEVDAWLSGTDTRTGEAFDRVTAPDPRVTIASGGRQPFTLTIPASQLRGVLGSLGVYGLAVEVRAQGESGREQVGLLRTTLQWQPGPKEYQPQQVAFLIPFTGLPVGEGGNPATDAEVAAAVGPGSRLRRLLDGASGGNVSWAVDPALLQRVVEVAAPTAAGSATSAPTTTDAVRRTAADFLTAMRAAAQNRTILELPYADPDLAAVTAPVADGRSRPDLASAALRQGGAATIRSVLGVEPAGQVGWPVGGWADDGTLAVLAAAGVRDVVLDERARPLLAPLTYTTDARADLGSGITGWLSDPGLSSLVGATSAPDVRRVQQLLAQTFAATTEQPNLVRRMLVVAPRDLDPAQGALRALTDAAAAVPWVQLVPVTKLHNPLPPDEDTAALPRQATAVPAPVAASQLGAAHVAAVRRSRSILAAIGEVTGSASGLTGSLQQATLELLSTSWRGQPQPLRERRAVVASDVTALGDQLQVLRSSVNLLASSGTLQITVVNSLPQDVAGARLEVTSGNPRLIVQNADVEVPDLASGTRTQVRVPVRAIASGVVQLDARLVSPSGRSLGKVVQVTVRAQPTGSWALWVVGGVVALVLAVGLVRALRRPRRGRTLTAERL